MLTLAKKTKTKKQQLCYHVVLPRRQQSVSVGPASDTELCCTLLLLHSGMLAPFDTLKTWGQEFTDAVARLLQTVLQRLQSS